MIANVATTSVRLYYYDFYVDLFLTHFTIIYLATTITHAWLLNTQKMVLFTRDFDYL